MGRERHLGVALVLVSAVGFGSAAVLARLVYATGMGWLTLLTWRFLLGALLTWGWLLMSAKRRGQLRHLSRQSLLTAVGLGAGYTIVSATSFAGFETVPASLAGLILFTYPGIVVILSLKYGWPLEGWRTWIALLIILLGLTMAIGGIDTAEAPAPLGLVLVCISPILYAVWVMLATYLGGVRRESSNRRVSTDSDTSSAAAISAVMLTTTLGVYLLIALFAGLPMSLTGVPQRAWPGVIGLAFLSTFVAVQTFYAGARRIGGAHAAIVSSVEPVWTISLAALLLGENLGLVQLVGGGLIILGVLAVQRSALGSRAAAQIGRAARRCPRVGW